MDGAINKQLITAVESVLISPIRDQLEEFGQVMALYMMDNPLKGYGAIGKINRGENAVKMMGSYNPAKPLACLIEYLEKGRELSWTRGQKPTNAMMVSK